LPASLAEDLSTTELPEEVLSRQEVRNRVRAALHTLSLRHRRILLARYEEGLSFAEVAERQGITVGAAKALAVRAREALRRTLGKDLTGDRP
jgi:RNA polymerase sigma-70 factor (ECF subfamily)